MIRKCSEICLFVVIFVVIVVFSVWGWGFRGVFVEFDA